MAIHHRLSTRNKGCVVVFTALSRPSRYPISPISHSAGVPSATKDIGVFGDLNAKFAVIPDYDNAVTPSEKLTALHLIPHCLLRLVVN
jgi:hypothetical protein